MSDVQPMPLARVARVPVRGALLLEPLLVWLGAMGLLWAWGATPLAAWERAVWGVPVLATVVAFVLLPLLVLRLSRVEPGTWGLAFLPLRRPLAMGLDALTVLGPLAGALFGLLGLLGWSPRGDLRGGALLTLGYLLALPAVAALVDRRAGAPPAPATSRHLLGLVGVLVAGAVALAVVARESPLLARAGFVLVVGGLGEELFFRGYLQGRLDRAVGWSAWWLGVPWSAGLLGGALLFGLAHLLSPAAPGHPGWAAWTAALGLVLGCLRARSGSVLAPALVHGVLSATGVLVAGFGAPGPSG